jgi:rubrerythrin
MPATLTREKLLENFLSSAFFAEDDAAPVVSRLLEHPCDPDERAAIAAYGVEEELHAKLLDELLERRGITRGVPFVVQRFFHLVRSRASILCQTYHVELLAGVFYGAVARSTNDPEIRALLERISRDEARHIRLQRELYRREIARSGRLARIKTRALAWALRSIVHVTAWLQARQLEPLIGESARELPAKVRKHLVSDLPRLFPSPRLAGGGAMARAAA